MFLWKGMTGKSPLCRPVALATRSVEVLAAALWVGSGLLWDRLTGGWERNRPQRARQVKTAIERLGAAYIKASVLSCALDCAVQAMLPFDAQLHALREQCSLGKPLTMVCNGCWPLRG